MFKENIERIKFLSLNDIKLFVELMSKHFECDIDISIDPNDRRTYDAKSLLGVMSLDFSKYLYVSIVTDDKLKIDEFKAIIRQFQEEK